MLPERRGSASRAAGCEGWREGGACFLSAFVSVLVPVLREKEREREREMRERAAVKEKERGRG